MVIGKRKEGNVLCNDALNTFYFQLYGEVYIMVKNHSDSVRGNPQPSVHGLISISSKYSFISIIPHIGYHIPRSLLHQSWDTSWNKKLLSVSPMKDRSDDP